MPRALSHPMAIVLGAAVLNSIWFHGPLWGYLGQHLDFAQSQAWTTALAVALIPTLLSLVFFSGLALVSNRLLKLGLILTFFCNAFALYFMQQYSVVLDKSMLSNVWNTNPDEAMQLLHPKLALDLLLWGGIPSALVGWWPIRSVPWWQKCVGALALPLTGGALLYALAFTWLWIDQHAGEVGSRLLPWSYVINSARHWQQAAHDSMTFSPLPDATPAPGSRRPRVVVLVIGESARADRHSALGYARPTNEYTQAVGAVSLAGVQACASYTTAALNCILSHRGIEAPERSAMGEPLPSYLQRQGVEVIWRTANSGHPPIQVARFETLGDIQKNCRANDCPPDRLDEGLLYGLKDLLTQSRSERILVVLHLSGSHGPKYHEKYPPQFERFKPVCRSVILQDCDQASLNNAYDNSILYTDHVLARLAELLRQIDASSAWLYVADHGESLGESGLYLHGTPRMMAPKEQIDIPMMLWFSDTLRREFALDTSRLKGMTGVGQGHVFHTVMGLLALSGGPYQAPLDVFNASRSRSTNVP